MFVKTLMKLFNISKFMNIALSLFSKVQLFELISLFLYLFILFFTLSLNINCSRKQQKLEIEGVLHSLRLDLSVVWMRYKFHTVQCKLRQRQISSPLIFGQDPNFRDCNPLQVNLCQKLLFLPQLTHNMTTDCSLN